MSEMPDGPHAQEERPRSAEARHLTPAVVPHRGHARHLREKLAVFGAFAEQALVCEAGFDARPALQALGALAAQEHPQAFRVQAGDWLAPWLGWGVDANGHTVDLTGGWPELGPLIQSLPLPWRHAVLLALAFHEDFIVLEGPAAHQRWMVVALPGFWAPELQAGLPCPQALPAAGHECIVTRPSPTPRLHAHPQRTDTASLGHPGWWRQERISWHPVPGHDQRIVLLHADTRPAAPAAPHRP